MHLRFLKLNLKNNVGRLVRNVCVCDGFQEFITEMVKRTGVFRENQTDFQPFSPLTSIYVYKYHYNTNRSKFIKFIKFIKFSLSPVLTVLLQSFIVLLQRSAGSTTSKELYRTSFLLPNAGM